MRPAPEPVSLGQIAEAVGATLDGDANVTVRGLASLDHAVEGTLAHLSNPLYRDKLASCAATAVLLAPEDRPLWPGAALVSSNPYLAYARASALFRPASAAQPGVHQTAVIADDAEVAASATVAPGVQIGPRSIIGAGASIGPNTVIGADCEIGAGCVLHGSVILVARVRLGANSIVHSGAVIGGEGFGFTPDERGQWTPIAQLGGVTLGENVSIGANTTIDCGAIDDTVIEDGVKIDNLCQIAHNCHIGAHTLICGCVGIVGSTRIGRHCVLAGGCGIGGDRPIELCDQVIISARTLVTQSISEPGTYSGGVLHAPTRIWKRNALRFQQLDVMMRRLLKLEKRMDAGAQRLD